MKTIGLISDTHGRADSAQHAVQVLLDHGADCLIHLGDVGSTACVDALADTDPATAKQVEAHLVFGNCDFDAASLGRYALGLGIHVHQPFGQLDVDGCKIAFTHGHLGSVMDHLLAEAPDYLLHGHTHLLADERHGPTRIINPGAMFRASRHTVALLEPASGNLRVLEVAGIPR